MSSSAPIRIDSVRLPLGFIAVGIASVLGGMVLLAVRPELLTSYHYNQHIVGATHLFVLGWICSVVFGAVYQLVPVALETRLFSERLARWHFPLHAAGVAGMVAMFWSWNLKGVAAFGAVFAGGVVLFIVNIGRTLARVPQWNVVPAGIACALGWLAAAVTAGLLLLASKTWGYTPFDPIRQMHAHAHLGGVGFVLMLIVAVSFKLVPMFVLGEIQSAKRAVGSLALLNAGLAGLTATMLPGHPLKLFFALTIAAGLAVYGMELAAIVRARKRRPIDWGIRYFLTGIALLAPLCALALPLSWQGLPLTARTGRMENAYGLLALLGAISLALLGMLYKIVPFLVWYHRYSREIGRRKVPALADLYSKGLQKAGYWLYLAGLALSLAATTIGHPDCARRGAAIWAVSIALFAANIGKICRHLARPKEAEVPLNAAKGTT